MHALKEVSLIWVPDGVTPSEGCFDTSWLHRPRFKHQPFGDDIKAAIEAAVSGRTLNETDHLKPWIKAGTGEGSAIFNLQGILVVALAYGVI